VNNFLLTTISRNDKKRFVNETFNPKERLYGKKTPTTTKRPLPRPKKSTTAKTWNIKSYFS